MNDNKDSLLEADTEVKSYMSLIKDDSNRKRVVVKGNALVDGRYRLDGDRGSDKGLAIMGLKLLLAMISRVNPRSDSLPKFTLTQKDIVNLDIGVGKKTIYRTFSQECLKLLSLKHSITERDLATGKVRVKNINYFEGNDEYWADEEKTVLEKVVFTFTSGIKPYLNNLGRDVPYTQYLHHYAKLLPTTYSLLLYELLRRYRNIRETKPVITANEDLIDLRERLDIPANKYVNFNNFKKGVLEPSIKHINDLTDINVDFKGLPGSKGKKIQVVQFYIRRNALVESQFDDDIDSDAQEGVVIPDNIGFDDVLANRIMDTFSYDIKGNFNEVVELFKDYSVDVLKESLSAFNYQDKNKKINLRKSNKWAFFRGICSNKNKAFSVEVEAASSKPGMKRDPTDTSWADGLNLDDDYPI